jgi:hypothetical protein
MRVIVAVGAPAMGTRWPSRRAGQALLATS